MNVTDTRSEVREFLASRRGRVTPEQVGLPTYVGNRRAKGLRREEIAFFAGASVDYYVRLEQGYLHGASDQVGLLHEKVTGRPGPGRLPAGGAR